MSGDQPAASFENSSAQPPTPQQTPTSGIATSPIFETPKPSQGFFAEASAWTPNYAESYSVFNATPGNLRGTDGPFVDFQPVTPGRLTSSHKRLLSAEGLAAEITTPANNYSPNLHRAHPSTEPSKGLGPSPVTPTLPSQRSPDLDARTRTNKSGSVKKARRGTVRADAEPIQTATPPPSARKGGRKVLPRPNMQNDHAIDSLDFHDASQQHPQHQQTQQSDMSVMMGNPADIFGYPMSAPVSAPPNFWDPTMAMSMNMGFASGGADVFNHTQLPHDPSATFNWETGMDMFQDPNSITQPPPSSNQENIQPIRHQQMLPKSFSEQASLGSSAPIPTLHAPASIGESFSLMSPGNGVDPGLLFGRPQTSATDVSFNDMPSSGSAEAAIAGANRESSGSESRRNSSAKEPRNGKMPDRAYASSPIKSSARPGLGRSMSENKGRKPRGGSAAKPLPALAPTARRAAQGKAASSSSAADAGRPIARPTGRTSPLKGQHRQSNLASIPEVSSLPRSRSSVRFTIDAHGRARAESMLVSEGLDFSSAMPRSHSARDLSRDHWDSSDDESSTDDEPIIIPSRNSSFSASFALPDPRKPVGSIFHSSKRSLSDRSNSISSADGQGVVGNGAESDAETVMDERQDKGGDATSELRKMVQDRQQRGRQVESVRAKRFMSVNRRSFNSNLISPASMTGSSYAPDAHGVRCVCHRNEADEAGGFMVQCESCEMWLHGNCINIGRRSMPRVYICAFCADTPHIRGGRGRDAGQMSSMGLAPASSPLASKSFRSFR